MAIDASAEGHHEQDRSGSSAGDAREVVEQLRSAPAEQVIAAAFLVLVNAARIKLGRRDARLLIDLGTVMLGYAGTYLPDRFVKQVEQSLEQLRLAQVSRERGSSERATRAERSFAIPNAALDQQCAHDGYRFPLTGVDALGSRAMKWAPPGGAMTSRRARPKRPERWIL